MLCLVPAVLPRETRTRGMPSYTGIFGFGFPSHSAGLGRSAAGIPLHGAECAEANMQERAQGSQANHTGLAMHGRDAEERRTWSTDDSPSMMLF